MSTTSKPVLYEFVGSVWANVPKLAISEGGFEKDAIKFESINLAEGANFNPEYLKITKAGTVPALSIDGKVYDSSASVTTEIIRRAPHPPQTDAATSTSLIDEVHADSHDPNATLLFARNDKDRKEKADGFIKDFLGGRQKALDKYAPFAPEEFKSFLQGKQKFNKGLLDFYVTDVDESARKEHYSQAASLWKSAGTVIRGPITQALKKTSGPFVAGAQPGEADYHLITWLARTASNAGAEEGAPSSAVIPKLEEITGGEKFDPVVAKYWDAWVARESFKANNIH